MSYCAGPNLAKSALAAFGTTDFARFNTAWEPTALLRSGPADQGRRNGAIAQVAVFQPLGRIPTGCNGPVTVARSHRNGHAGRETFRLHHLHVAWRLYRGGLAYPGKTEALSAKCHETEAATLRRPQLEFNAHDQGARQNPARHLPTLA